MNEATGEKQRTHRTQPRLERTLAVVRTAVATGGFPLFGYGTFRDPAWRVEILGADYPWEHAMLRGWQRVTFPASDYLSIRESEYDLVEGVLVELDDVGWRVADAWEEVPKYARIPVEVRTASELVAARSYVFAGSHDDAIPLEDENVLASIPARDVERSIRAFRPMRDAIRAGQR
ncbi:MAG TPA: gamma-glutamylcyclotransferase family protein [Candidatus Elarobacter sp.]|nr:gamma-glutamylcyclotransferase family protein [Candidatus Elarobacter sp.]